MDGTALLNAMLKNISNPTAQQKAQAQVFVNELIALIESAKITLTPASVVAPAGGGPCTQSGPTIGTLS